MESIVSITKSDPCLNSVYRVVSKVEKSQLSQAHVMKPSCLIGYKPSLFFLTNLATCQNWNENLSRNFIFLCFHLTEPLFKKKEGIVQFFVVGCHLKLTRINDFFFNQTFTFLKKNVAKVICNIDTIYYVPIRLYIHNYSKDFLNG